MQRRLSQFVHNRFRRSDSDTYLLTLHRYNTFTESTRDEALETFPNAAITGIQASKGVYLGRTITGYQWYVGPLAAPSPVHYGDAIAELERFLWDELDMQHDSTPRRPFLAGWEQGAVMALAMAAATPQLLSGVIAYEALFPAVSGWEPPLAPLDGLPLLLINPTYDANELRLLFESWGAHVTVMQTENQLEARSAANAWLMSQPVRRLQPAPA
jgi:predicted esterase